MTDNPSNTPNPVLLWPIHFAFMLAIPIYALLVFLLRPEAPLARLSLLPVVLLVAGLGAPLVGLLVGRLMHAAAVRPGIDPPTRLARRLATVIMQDAFYESAALFGLIGSFFGMPLWVTGVLMVVSLGFLTSQIPMIRRSVAEAHEAGAPQAAADRT